MNNESTERIGSSGNSEYGGNNEYMSSQVYENVETSFSLRNKNSTDYDQLNEFFQQRNSSHEKIIAETKKEQLKDNLEQWDSSVPPHYAQLSLKNVDKSRNKRIIAKVKKAHSRSIFVFSENPNKREEVVYAILRDYVKMGFLSLSKVKHLTENDLVLWATVGFEGFKNLEVALRDRKIETFVVHGFSEKKYSEKEVRMLDKVINHCFYNNIKLIFSSGVGLGYYKEILQKETYSVLTSIFGENIVNT